MLFGAIGRSQSVAVIQTCSTRDAVPSRPSPGYWPGHTTGVIGVVDSDKVL